MASKLSSPGPHPELVEGDPAIGQPRPADEWMRGSSFGKLRTAHDNEF
jgi:hypothetical protein